MCFLQLKAYKKFGTFEIFHRNTLNNVIFQYKTVVYSGPPVIYISIFYIVNIEISYLLGDQ